MTTIESQGRFFLQNESIRIANWNALGSRHAILPLQSGTQLNTTDTRLRHLPPRSKLQKYLEGLRGKKISLGYYNYFIILHFTLFYYCTASQRSHVRRYNWHSAGSLGWQFPMLKDKNIFPNKINGSNFIKRHSDTIMV